MSDTSGDRPDLADRAEIATFVRGFYRRLARDDRLAPYFTHAAQVDWDAHARDLTSFWCGVLLDEPDRDADRVIEAHRWLHDAAPFDAELFDRWLAIFGGTLDDGWAGPIAERARRRAHGYAWAMARRLAGIDIGTTAGMRR